MSVQLFYFTGTGNSLFVAQELSKVLKDVEITSITKCLNSKLYISKADSVGFIFPIHGLTIPIPVKIFLNKLKLENATYIFAVPTRGGTIFRGTELIKKILNQQCKKLNSIFLFTIFNNDPKLSFFELPTKEEIISTKNTIIAKILTMKTIIEKKLDYFDYDGVTFSKNKFLNNILEKLVPFMTHNISPKIKKYFYHDSKCIGCQTCEKICPSDKIVMQNNKPIWKKQTTCYLCYGCLNSCPKESVQIYSKWWMKSYTETKGRYAHPYVSIKEIITQK